MTRDARVVISRIILTAVYLAGLAALVTGSFAITLATVSAGFLIWLMYLLSAALGTNGEEGGASLLTVGKNVSRALAGLGAILAIGAVAFYGLEQTMWGGYNFKSLGFGLALGILVITLLPLVILKLIEGRPSTVPEPAAAVPPSPQSPLHYPPEAAADFELEEGDEELQDEDEWEEEYEDEEDYYEYGDEGPSGDYDDDEEE